MGKIYRTIAAGLIAALFGVTVANAQQYVQTPYINMANPSNLLSGDLVICSRGGISFNCSWPAALGSFPIATGSTVGMVKPGSGMLVGGDGSLNVTVTSGSFTNIIGTMTSANPFVGGEPMSGFYSPSANIIGVELNHVAAMQWNTLASGVDYMTVTPGKSGTAPTFGVAGTTANQGLNLTATGSGNITVNGLVISSAHTVTTGIWNGTVIGIGYGGTGVSSAPSNGQLLIGNGTNFTLATPTAGTGIGITTTAGGFTISATGSTTTGIAGQAAFYTTSTSTAGTSNLLFNTTTTPGNSWSMGASTTGNPITLTATGPDTNIIGKISGKGTGGAAIGGTTTGDNAPTGFVGEYASAQGVSSPGTCTITIASPAVVTLTGHGISGITAVTFSTNGALPTGLVSGTIYYTIPATVTTNTYQVATSIANAIAGTPVNTSGTQSGTQTCSGALFPSTGSSVDVAALSLAAGDWDIYGNVSFIPASGTVQTDLALWSNTASATLPPAGQYNLFQATFTTSAGQTFNIPFRRVSVATTTTVYLTGNAAYSVSNELAIGGIQARRVR